MKSLFLFFAFTLLLLFGFAESTHSNPVNKGFIENKGQIFDQNFKPNEEVKFINNSIPGLNIQLKNNSFSFDSYVIEKPETNEELEKSNYRGKFGHDLQNFNHVYKFHRVDVTFLGACSNPEIIANNPSEEYFNYYNSVTPEEGATYVHHFSSVVYKNLYPEIDLEFIWSETENSFKYNFIVHPGGNIKDILIKYTGANSTILKDGNIEISLEHGNLTETIPLSFLSSTNKEVKVSYTQISENIFSFNAEEYNLSEELVIDPSPTLSWATYYGGTFDEIGEACRTDAYEYVYIAGTTSSSNNVATTGSHQSTYGAGNTDAFLAKFNDRGQRMWATYYGGDDEEYGYFCNPDGNGKVYLVGRTSSTNAISTTNSHQTSLGGLFDGFIAKFNNAGVRAWGTYYGGSSDDAINNCYTNSQGQLYFTGWTKSNSSISTQSAHQTSFGGGGFWGDAFLAKFSAGGTQIWGTYYGGSGEDNSAALGLDASGNVFISGLTTSSNAISSTNAYQTNLSGSYDAFIAKFNPSGNLLWGSYFGGTGAELGYSCGVDGLGNVFITGETSSSNGISTTGAHQTVHGGGRDLFLAKFNGNGGLLWGTYLGGNNEDYGWSCFTGPSNEVYVTGFAASTSNISSIGAYQTTNAGNEDGLLAKFNSAGVRIWSTYYGGPGLDRGYDCTMDQIGRIYLFGFTSSTNGISSPNCHQSSLGGGYDAFLVQFDSSTTTGMEANSVVNSFVIYPVPTSNTISFSLNKTLTNAEISVIDISGKIVITEKLTELVSGKIVNYSVVDLPVGLYMVQITAENEYCTSKFIKE